MFDAKVSSGEVIPSRFVKVHDATGAVLVVEPAVLRDRAATRQRKDDDDGDDGQQRRGDQTTLNQ